MRLNSIILVAHPTPKSFAFVDYKDNCQQYWAEEEVEEAGRGGKGLRISGAVGE